MNTLSAFHAALRLGFAAGLALAVGLGQAQSPGRIKPVPQPVAPALPTTGLPTTGTPAATPSDAAVVQQQPFETGGRAYGAGAGAPGTTSMGAMGAGPYSAVQLAQSFLGADVNRDGELTRAEAQRLTIAPYSFEEMDRNRDGIITRFEYDDAVR